MGKEISIHTAFFVSHFKIALPSVYGILTNASIIFFHLSCNQLPRSDMQIPLFKCPTGI